MVCRQLRDICSCSCLPVLPGPTWVLLSKIYRTFLGALYDMFKIPIFACFWRFSRSESQTCLFAQKFDRKLTCLFDRHPGLLFLLLKWQQKPFFHLLKACPLSFTIEFLPQKSYFTLQSLEQPNSCVSNLYRTFNALRNPSQPEIAS